MARTSSLNISERDVAAIDLGRVLPRLEHKILSADADPRLLHSSYERTKTSAVILLTLSTEEELTKPHRTSNTPAPSSYASNTPLHPSSYPRENKLPKQTSSPNELS